MVKYLHNIHTYVCTLMCLAVRVCECMIGSIVHYICIYLYTHYTYVRMYVRMYMHMYVSDGPHVRMYICVYVHACVLRISVCEKCIIDHIGLYY